MKFEVDVTVEKEDGTEETVDVYFELDDFYECMDWEKIAFIKEQTKMQHKDIAKIYFDEDDLEDLEREIEDMNDTSDLHPNETFEEFMEHEDF